MYVVQEIGIDRRFQTILRQNDLLPKQCVDHTPVSFCFSKTGGQSGTRKKVFRVFDSGSALKKNILIRLSDNLVPGVGQQSLLGNDAVLQLILDHLLLLQFFFGFVQFCNGIY
jgi:hypothetical protein